MFIIIYHSIVQNMYNISTVHIIVAYIIIFLSCKVVVAVVFDVQRQRQVVTRHLAHSTLWTFGIALVRNTLFILLIVIFLSHRLSGVFIYTRARVYFYTREISHRDREKNLCRGCWPGGVGLAAAAAVAAAAVATTVAAGRRSPLTQPATVTET